MKRQLSLAALVALTGCAETIGTPVEVTSQLARMPPRQMALAHSAIAYDFKDPESAKYRGETSYRLSNGDWLLCGEVNAKNSFGAYVGYESFMIRLRGDQVRVLMTDIIGPSCANAAKGRLIVDA